MSLGISSGIFSSALGNKSAVLPGLSSGAADASFGEMFQDAQGYLDNPTGLGMGTSKDLESSEDSFSRLSDDAFNAVKLQIQMKLQALMEKQKAEEQGAASPDLSKTDKLIQFSHYLGAILDDMTRVGDHEKAGGLLDKVLLKLQERAEAGDLDAHAFLIDLV
jgi:hypothetical protein